MYEKIPIELYSKLNKDSIQILAYISDKCNFNCWYCYNTRPRTNKILDLNALYQLILFLHKNTNKRINIDLIGGEPTMHPDLNNFIEKISSNSYIHCNLYTNFCKDIQFYQKLVENNVELSITYHYQYDAEQFYSNVVKLLNAHAILNISVMYEPKHIEQSIQLYTKLKKLIGISTLELSLVFSDTKNRIVYPYDKFQLDLYDNTIKDYKPVKEEYIIKYNDGTEEQLSFYDLQSTLVSTKNWLCYAGIEFLDIDVDGNVYSCSVIKKKLYNLYDNNKFFIPKHPTICNNKYCQCKWDITKKRIFK